MRRYRNEIIIKPSSVIKRFTVGEIALEKMVYKQLSLSNIKTAQIIEEGEDVLVFSRLDGPTMNALFETSEAHQDDFLPYLLEWEEYLRLWHEAIKDYRYGDVNMNNFIYVNHQWIGIDFEQIVIGTIEEDFSDMMCFILFHSPKLTEYKYQLVRRWLQSLTKTDSQIPVNWERKLQEALGRLNQRRNSNEVLDMHKIMGGSV